MSVIEHSATVTAVDGETVTVEIASRSACATCCLKDGCGIFDCRLHSLQIYSPTPERYQPGQTVMVTIAENRGWAAVLFAYVLPLMLVLSTLAVTWIFTADETAAAIYSLTILIPYYLVLRLFHKSFTRRFSFKIRD